MSFNLQCCNCKKWKIGDKWINLMPKYWPTDKPVSHGLCEDCFKTESKKLDDKGIA